MLGTGAYLVVKQEITPGVMIAGAVLVSRALAPLEQAVGSWRNFVGARAAYGRVRELLEVIPPDRETMALPKPEGHVAVEQVLATVPGRNVTAPVLRNVSFRLAPGEVLGIIGPTAAGKSTLARLLVGVWPALGGSVRLDNADVHQWDHVNLGKHIGYLPQDVELFDGTIAENIARFGAIDSEAVIGAARKASVHDMVLRLPQGYDTPIGEGGRVLSGGQRQRIALARALYGDPALIVLDEPNANLDNEGELALIAAISESKKAGRTVIIIAHRPSILGGVDKMLVLQNGTVEAFGPRNQVMARYGPGTATSAQPRQVVPIGDTSHRAS